MRAPDLKQVKILFMLIFSVLLWKSSLAQPIQVSVTIVPPYDSDLFTYTDDANRVLITLTNTSGATHDLKLGGVFHTIDDRINVSTNPDYQPAAPVTLGPGESRMLNANDLYNIFPDENSIIATGITRAEVLRTRRLPAGIWQLCITAYDYHSPQHSVPLSAVVPAGCSAPFRIGLINAPSIISFGGTLCGEQLEYSESQNFLIQWTIPPELPVGGRYILEMIELYPADRNPFDAFESATLPIFFNDSVDNRNNYMYTLANPLMESGRSYAIRIKAVDPTGSLRFANNGYSQPCIIRYGSAQNGMVSLESYFPQNRDYIPFRYFPIMVHFDPYDDQLYRFNFDFNLYENGTFATRRSDELRWPWGPRESQSRALGIDIPQDASQFIAVNESNARVAQEFNRGASYRYNVNGYFLHRTTGERQPLSVSCTDEFISGLGIPLNQQPTNESQQDPGLITFQFQTAEFPSSLVPSFSIMQSGSSRSPSATFFDEKVIERYVIEVSRQQNFSTILRSNSRKFEPNVTLNQCISENNLLNDSIYRSLQDTFRFNDTGWYYWRVKWVTDDNDQNSPAYATSEIWKFRIGDSGPEVTRDTARRTPASCLADCAVPTPANRTEASTAAVGDDITAGKFTLHITEISWSGNRARGRGTVRVPFMNAPLKVSFSNIAINAERTMIQGELVTENDNTALLPSSLVSAAGRFTGMGETQSRELHEWLVTAGRLVNALSGTEPMGMPLGIDNTIDGQRVVIAILGCKFGPTMATLNAMVSVDIPEVHGWLSLGANEICFHPGGLNAGQGMLYLPDNHDLPFSDDITLSLRGQNLPRDSGTYVSWDCEGFKELALSGAFIFGRNVLVPDADDGSAGPGNVEARFKVKVQRMGNWVCALDMDPFQAASLPEWGFAAQEAWLDFSDLQNPTSMEFPEGYGGDRSNLWRGFYLKRLGVRLPNEFKTYSEPDRRITAGIRNVLIDGTGLSAKFSVENLVRVTDGNLDGWAFSLDTVYLSLVSNDFRNAGLSGKIGLPISDHSTLKYNASLNRSSAGDFAFEFRIQPVDTFRADIWEADLELFPSSFIGVTIDGEGFMARADLSGVFSFSGTHGGGGGASLEGMSFTGMHFEHFCINTRGPNYVSIGSFHMAPASEQHSAGGFPLSISGINLTTRDGPSMMEFDQSPGMRLGIEFVVDLSLSGESNTFHASTKIAILGKLTISGERQDWTFSGLNLDSIAIGGSVGCVSIEGYLAFYNSHPTYGKGVKGYISVSFRPTIEVSATVQFGEVRGFRYWYVDAMATWSPGVTIFSGVDLRGFGGAAWYHMRAPEPVPFSRIVGTSVPTSETAGTTATGRAFTPDNSMLFGFEASIKVGATGGSSAYHGLITFGAEFATGGGIANMFLRGDFIIMSETDNRREASASADFYVGYNFTTNTFQANFSVYVNVAGVLRGVNENNLAGRMEILVCPETWHIFVGQPTQPIGLRLTLGDQEIARAQFYLMVGLSLPPMPPLPDRIARELSINPVRDPAIGDGDGFAMGTLLSISTGRLGMMPFYARFDLDFGFDLAVKKYTTACAGMPPGSTIGADGWYANGQIYAYFSGSIGLYVDLFFVSGEFEILGVTMAAYMAGGFPNPNWMEGAISGRYSILNGAINGSCRFDVKVGERCSPPLENPMAGMELVADLFPPDGARNVDCGVEPQAVYNYTLGREFSLTQIDDQGRNQIRTFKVLQENTKLAGGGLTEVPVNPVFRDDNTTIVLSPLEFLNSNTPYTFSTTGVVYEYIGSNWVITKDLSNRPLKKTYTSHFTTGARPDRIRDIDVSYTYPMLSQRFYLQNECRTGQLALKRNMSYLFSRPNKAGYEWHYFAKITPVNGGSPMYAELRNTNSYNIYYDMPSLNNNVVYKVEFVAIRRETSAGLASRITAESTIRKAYNTRNVGASTINIQTKSINGTFRSEEITQVVLYTYFFKTSQYNSLSEKLNASPVSAVTKSELGLLQTMRIAMNGEGMDPYDILPTPITQLGISRNIGPLVGVSGLWDKNMNPWMTHHQYYTYDFRDWLQSQGFVNHTFRNRQYGIPPQGPVYFSSDCNPKSLLSQSETRPPMDSSLFANLAFIRWANPPVPGFRGFSNIQIASNPGSGVLLQYDLGIITLLHYNEIKNRALGVVAVYGLWESEFLTAAQKSRLAGVVNGNYQKFFNGTYKARFWYSAPSCPLGPDDFGTYYPYPFELTSGIVPMNISLPSNFRR